MNPEDSFLGVGWAFPPTFTLGGGHVETVAGAEDVHESLRILLATRLGERVMREDFGCDLDPFLFEEVDQGLINAITQRVTDAIVLYEPRIDLDRVEVSESPSGAGGTPSGAGGTPSGVEGTPSGAGGTLLLIEVFYTLRSTNSRFNLVYPFYLDEAATRDLEP